jgi:hypothetical protein
VSPGTAQGLITEYVDHCRKRPPGQVLGQLGKQIAGMLAEGIDPDDVRHGLAVWAAKDLHPSVLPSVVNEVMNGGSSRPRPTRSTTNDRVEMARQAGIRAQAILDAQTAGSAR